VEIEQAVARWVDCWSRGWAARDADVVAEAYAEEGRFQSHPFREPAAPHAAVREYARLAFADQEGDAEFRFGTPVCAGDRAFVRYWAVIPELGGETTLMGVSLLRFGPDGLCVEHRDYWAAQDGRSEPPAGDELAHP
jgi:hypothetical protein